MESLPPSAVVGSRNAIKRRFARARRSGGDDPGAQAIGTTALGSIAVGALAFGALAIGALTVGRLFVGRARIRRLEIDELVVRRVRVLEQLTAPSTPDADGPGATAASR